MMSTMTYFIFGRIKEYVVFNFLIYLIFPQKKTDVTKQMLIKEEVEQNSRS